jgi:hypothetical protein
MRGFCVAMLAPVVLVACSKPIDRPPTAPQPGGTGGGAGGAGAIGGFGAGGAGASAGAAGSGGSGGQTTGPGGSGETVADAAGGTAGSTSSPDGAASVETPDGGVAISVGDNGMTFPIPPGLTQIFDGKTLEGWSGNPAIWSVKDGAIYGKTGNGGQLIKTTAQYDDFRVILTEKMIATPNHMGVCFWGSAGGFGYGSCIDVIPPSGSLWDYAPGGGQLPGGVGSANNPIKYMWHQVEILALASTGEILVAVNGKQTTDYKKPGRGKKGPIGLQSHAGANEQAYKDIWVEVAPKEHRLLTVKP